MLHHGCYLQLCEEHYVDLHPKLKDWLLHRAKDLHNPQNHSPQQPLRVFCRDTRTENCYTKSNNLTRFDVSKKMIDR